MKTIRTVPSFVHLEVDGDTDKPRTLTGTPLRVSDDDAARYEKLAAEVDVMVEIGDADDDVPTDLDDGTDPDGVDGPAPALTGEGDPVPAVENPTAPTPGKTGRTSGKNQES